VARAPDRAAGSLARGTAGRSSGAAPAASDTALELESLAQRALNRNPQLQTEAGRMLAAEWRIEHGGHCDCKLLALALHLDPRTISLDYCQRVLQEHWRMTCRHGSQEPMPREQCLADRWRDMGPMDPVKAILLDQEAVE
jgi:hypothetical protein